MPPQPVAHTAPKDASSEMISAVLARYNLNQEELDYLLDVCERLRLEGSELVATRQYVEATRVYRGAVCVGTSGYLVGVETAVWFWKHISKSWTGKEPF
jgi:hypothetical protein